MRYIHKITFAVIILLGTFGPAHAITQREKCTTYIGMMETFLQVAQGAVDAGIDVYTNDQIKAFRKFPPAARAQLTKRKYGNCVGVYKQFYAVVEPSDRRTLQMMERDNFSVSK